MPLWKILVKSRQQVRSPRSAVVDVDVGAAAVAVLTSAMS
jgi:hypothetical protein